MININYRDSRPIYEQIRDNLRKMIITGSIKPDEKLPSVRDLASEMAINPNTIQRAYRELETEGYIYSVSGKGSFASESFKTDFKRKQELIENLKKTVDELMFLGVSREEIAEIIKEEQK